MKIRAGFVSNSSSSSFLCRGIKVPTEEFIKVMGIDLSKMGNDYEDDQLGIDQYVCYEAPECRKLENLELCTQTIRSFFDGTEAGEIIIGKSLSHGYDGEVAEVEEPDDEEIKGLLSQAGFSNAWELRTYMQYISNDNY